MRRVWTMTLSDLRQRIRDKSVIIFGLVVPLALMGVLNLVIGDSDEVDLQPVTVAVAVPEDDQLGRALAEVLGSLDTMEVTVREAAPDEIRSLAEAGEADLGVTVPDGFTAAVSAGDPVRLDVVEGDDTGIEVDVLLSVLRGTLDRFSAGAVAAAAGAAVGVPPGELAALAQEVGSAPPSVTLAQGQGSSEQLSTSGALVAGQAGLFLLFTVGFGVLGLLAEREQGTLARLRSMPMNPTSIVLAKALVSFILGVVATSVLLAVGGRLFGVAFGSPAAVAVLIVCAVTATTSLMFIVVRVARTAEQAGIAQSILAMVLGIAGGAFFPVSSTGWAATLLDLNPVGAFIRGLGITSGGGGLGDIGAPVLTMLVFAAVALVVARLVPDRGVAA